MKVEHINRDLIYFGTGFTLLIICFLSITTIFVTNDYSLNLPVNNFFGIVSWIVTSFLGIAGILFLRNIDRKQIDLAKLFLILVIPLGILTCIVRPLGRVPDEDFHARKAMAISQGNFFSHANENGEATEFFNAKLNELVTRSSENYEEALSRLTAPKTKDMVELSYTTMALYAPICHLPQAFGMFITRIFGASIPIQCYAARLVNFSLAVFLIYEAIKLIPFKKIVVLFISLLPLTLQEIVSMSTDALIISMSIFYISYILYLKYDENKKEINKKDIIILTISSIVISLCKIVYIPLCLLMFVLPKEKFETLKNKNIVIVSILAVSVILNLIWLGYCSRFLIEFNSGVNSSSQVKYILTHPISYLFIFFRTINTYNQSLIVGLCGEGLGVYDVQASVIFIYPCIILATMLFLCSNKNEDIQIHLSTKLMSLFVFIIITVLIYTSLYVQWTTLESPIIHGVQSRYFLPILLLMSIVLNNKKIVFNEKLSNRYVLLFMLFLNLNVVAVIFFTYIKGVGIGVGIE